ncbi:MAG: glycosyltransferase family 4 protein [Candidatus Omnitrophica bacterium]|nr:glycosyltransferase family 4 protein [Candidatus Omnitrophota bacterium]
MYPSKKSARAVFVKNQIDDIANVGIDFLRVVKTKKARIFYLTFFLKSIFYLLFSSYDVIHAHYGFHSAFFPALIKRRPLVISFHRGDALDEPRRNWLYCKSQKFVVRRSDHLIAVSDEIKQALIHDLGATEDRVSIVSCGINTSVFTPLDKIEIREKLGISQDCKMVLFVGQLIRRKGLDIVLECARRMRDVTFFIIGEGKFLKEEILKTENCVFVGKVPNDEIPQWMNAADVFFLPSRSEGTPLVFSEALSCGLPAVVSDVGGCSAVVADTDLAKYVVAPDDVETFHERLSELMENPSQRKEVGKEGRDIILNKFAGKKIAQDIKDIYLKVCKNKNI